MRAELARHEAADRSYSEEGVALLELAGRAVELWESSPPPEKRRLWEFLCLNSELRNGRLTVHWKKPFDGLAQFIAGAKGMGTVFDVSDGAHPEWLRG